MAEMLTLATEKKSFSRVWEDKGNKGKGIQDLLLVI